MNRSVRVGIVVIAVLLVLNLVGTGVLFFSVSDVEQRMDDVEEENRVLEDHLLRAGQVSSQNGTDEPDDFEVEKRTGYMLAHDSKTDEGVMFSFTYQPLPGDAIYVDASDVTISPSFQESLRNSRAAVEQTDYEPSTYGMAVTMDTPEAWDFIRGESAGLAIAAEIAAMDPRYERNESVVLTGQVEPDGSVVSVNYIEQKGEAAGAEGKDVLVAPHTSRDVDADGVRVVHVQTLDEALDYALDPVNESNTTRTESAS